jgi:glycosyltransferase involved in cell wall biosynthesis
MCGLFSASGLTVNLLTTKGTAGHVTADGFTTRYSTTSSILSGLGYSPALSEQTRRLAPEADVFHIHGLWRLCTAQALLVARAFKVPAVVSPMGAFAPAALRKSHFRKRAFWWAFQRRSLDGVTCYHATSQLEHDHLRAFGIRSPIAVIALGTDLPPLPLSRPRESPDRTILFLGRICPIKNLLSLVQGWRSIQADFPTARLRIVGPDDRGHAVLVARAIQDLGAQRITIEPGRWGAARDRLYQEADLVILPSLSESFGLVAAEALAHGRAVIASTGSPWESLERERCGWWVGSSPASLGQAMRVALSQSGLELAKMGQRGRRLAERELGWGKAISRFTQLYRWVERGGAVPEFVSIGERSA